MSLKRWCCRALIQCLRVVFRNWTACAAIFFFVFASALRFAFFMPARPVTRWEDDFSGRPRHQIPHFPRNKNHILDAFDHESPRQIMTTDESDYEDSQDQEPTFSTLPGETFATSNKSKKPKSTTPDMLINGRDWRISTWELFAHFNWRNHSKLILFWTNWYREDFQSAHERRDIGPVIRLGKKQDKDGNWDDPRACYLGYEKSSFSDASAVVFHARTLEPGLGQVPTNDYRRPDQYWTYLDIEPPSKPIIDDPDGEIMLRNEVNAVGFNWTMSYSCLADVPHPYGRFVKKSSTDQTLKNTIEANIRKKLEDFSTREFDAAFFPSSCESNSLRERLIERLQNLGVKIELLGRCHKLLYPEFIADPQGEAQMWKRYRFYFAFETERCDDYLTQKVFRAYNASMNFGVIPVVYGAGKSYSKILPNGSYIDAEAFATVEELADLLKRLSSAPVAQLEPYFGWQMHYDIVWRFFLDGVQALCNKIWQISDGKADEKAGATQSTSVIDDVAAKLGRCYPPPFKWLGIDFAAELEAKRTTTTLKATESTESTSTTSGLPLFDDDAILQPDVN